MEPYYSSAPMAMDASHEQKFFKTEDNSGLEDSLLDHSGIDSGLDLSPPMESRRESFGIGGPLFSPKTEDWHSVDMQSLPSNNPFFEPHSTNPYMRFDQPSANPFISSGNPWAMNGGSGTATPFQRFGGMAADFDANTSIFQQPIHAPTPFPSSGNMFASLADGQAMQDGQPAAKKMRPSSPTIRSHNDLRRGDGIRKKNARFEIPAERNLSNIDQLIAQSTDEQEIKELKQQKRLLRNRQAALDSRQRKKQHTERLEDEKKQFTVVITDMEEELASLKTKVEQLMLEKQQCVDYIETLTLEKDEMIRTHTIETGELRKKVGVLTDHVQRLESSIPPNAAANGFSGSYDDMDDAMDLAGAWDNGFLNDFTDEVKPPMAVAPKKDNNPFTSESEKSSSQGGLLFMLFLVGAFVLSSRSMPSIPRVSEDVRVASATLLDNVLKDAGVSASASMHAIAPQPSGATWGQPVSASVMAGMAADGVVAPSMLIELGDSLMQPSQEQTNEQIFSLSAAQYNGVSDHDFLRDAPGRMPSKTRKNLAQALAELRDTAKQTGAAEVYTRTLLWDQIPNDVVRNFARMVVECNSAQNAQQCNEARS
ncbi:basic-leucine zipper domain-containing dna binding domain [Trichoderma arundinaceum]|uniref:Basic-leucine zipper domain-containing dna binding domain n=1 Tax=Trichoderma arundinaceum TaxID=490622 RepID=A0A395NPA9_TRIAR|nr:basic-leucine zipper domain-containing dna binding domain [Trichoderma arundinaceum]